MEKIRIAIQKSGRLSEKSLALFTECGINLTAGSGKLMADSADFPIEVLFLRDDDIPQYVADGVADVGIVGENVVKEKHKTIDIAERLGFGRCRLALAVPKIVNYTDVTYFEGKKIATSYPDILDEYLKKKGVNAEIHEISGSVEIAPGIGLADGIFDIVSSGSTLFSNNLKEVELVMNSEALLVANQKLTEAKRKIMNDLIFRIRAVQKARRNKYIILNAPVKNLDEIVRVIPGMKSPSVVPLMDKGWVSIRSVIAEKDFWEIIERIQELGAQGILVIPIEKMII